MMNSVNETNSVGNTPPTSIAALKYRTYVLIALIVLIAILSVVSLQCFRSMVIVYSVQTEHDSSISRMLEHGIIDVEKANVSLAKTGATFTLTEGSLAHYREATKHLIRTPSLDVLSDQASNGFWLSLIAAVASGVLLVIVLLKKS